MKIVVIGCGWLGLPLAASLARDGHEVHGTRTRADALDEITLQGVIAHRLAATPDLAGEVDVLAGADRVVTALPPSGLGDRYPEAIERIASASRDAAQIVHVSSTGVHPDRPGHPTTREDDLADEPSERAARLLAAERAVASVDGPSATVLRLAGLWGYGRNPVRHLAGRTLPGGDAPVNLVHRDDAIAAVHAVMLPEPVPGTFAVVADEHPTRAALYGAEAERLGLPAPRFLTGPSTGKRVVGDRLANTVGFRPRWQPGDPSAP